MRHTLMKQNNLWKETSEEKVAFNLLEDFVESDIAIVGGGYTGCSAALTAAENGLSVSLIDQQIGYGGSGRNVGLVNACLLYTSPSPRDATLSRMPSSA